MSILAAILSQILPVAGPMTAGMTAIEPPEVLTVPIKGTIGADATIEGFSDVLGLLKSRPVEVVVVEIDAQDGELDTGLGIARMLAAIPESIRVVGILERVGGPSLPIAWACEEWIVPPSIAIRVPDPRGGMTDDTLGPDRVVIRTLPPLATSVEAMDAELGRIRDACLEISGALPGIDRGRSASRRTLIEVLTTPRTALSVVPGDGTLGVASAPLQGSTVIDLASQGPGIRGDQLVSLGLADPLPDQIETITTHLGPPDAVSLEDTGMLLVEASADERAARRGRLGSRIDSLFSALDGVATLTAGAPWSIARARLSDPESARLATRFPMRWTENGWTIAETGMRSWNAACRDSVRRWSGVLELVETVDILLARSDEILDEIASIEPVPLDVARRDAAVATATSLIDSYRRTRTSLAAVPEEARREIRRIESLLDRPPVLESRD